MKIQWKKLLISLLIPLSVGALATLFTRNGIQSYNSINKPALSPPAWLFPVVWTILYTIMGITSYIVSTSKKSPTEKNKALTFYFIQLAVNFIWPILFFNFDAYYLSLLWIVLLLILVIITAFKFYNINQLSGYLWIPYIIWLCFATYLNYNIAITFIHTFRGI